MIEELEEKFDMNLTRKPSNRLVRILGWVALSIFVMIILVTASSAVYWKVFENKIYPGVYLSSYHLGKLTTKEAVSYIESLNNQLSKEGINLVVKKNDGTVANVHINNILASDDSLALIEFDSQTLSQALYRVGRTGAWWQKLYSPLYYQVAKEKMPASFLVNEVYLTDILRDNLMAFVDQANNANIQIVNWSTGQYMVIPEQSGQDFVYPELINKIEDELGKLSFAPIVISPQPFSPTISADEARQAGELVSAVFSYGDLGLNYINPQTNVRRDWVINLTDLSQWVIVKKDTNGQLILSLDPEKTKKYLDGLRQEIDKPAQDARFIIENNKVKEFQASQSGLALDIEKTFTGLVLAFEERNYHPGQAVKTVSLTLVVAEPNIKMSEVNDLGIEGVIGVGVSSFVGSHTDRIKNLTTAIKRLNGVLIQPGEIFSANKYAGPFTLENGFLPELVIKGREIKKEVGGGMCQIGTTLFRMAMNSGMDITERRNHSLVVSYYADPVNGNPGTDATLYEPILDLKFLNDTGHYLLLQTVADYKKKELVFTLWGTADGRKGSYTHPIVSRWIPPSKPEEVVSEKMKPGQKECQAAYTGAVASFKYTRITPAGEKIERVFDSYYRPLPKICLINKADYVCPEGKVCEVVGAVDSVLDPSVVIDGTNQDVTSTTQ
ncbi:MAG: VanW family protein [bacterium]|nr:VanW family protein [bacterium]